jgi:hypothetical protein
MIKPKVLQLIGKSFKALIKPVISNAYRNLALLNNDLKLFKAKKHL